MSRPRGPNYRPRKTRPKAFTAQQAGQRERHALIDRLALEGIQASEQAIYTTNIMREWTEEMSRDEWALLRYACRDNFWTFFLHAWGVLYGPHAEDWLSKRAPIAQFMAEWFQEQVEAWEESRRNKEDKQRRIMVMVTREFGKTTMFSQVGLAWIQLRNPNASTYIGSDKLENSVAILGGIKPVLDGSDKYALFSKLYGNWYNSDLTWTRESIVHGARTTITRKDPSFGTWGVQTGITGKHPDVLCLDDPNNYELLASDKNWLEVVNEHCASLQPALQVDGLLMYVGTPYGAKDNLRESLKRDGVATMSGLPMTDFAESENGKWHVLHIPGRDEDDAPTVPRVWPEQRMKDFKAENDSRYAAQVLLRPELSEEVPLTREQVEDCIVDEDKVPMKMLRFTMHFDTAWKDANSARKGDESVIEIWGHFRDGSGDVVFIEGYSSNIWRADDFYNQVTMLLQKYRRLNRKIVAITDEMSPGKRGSNEMLLQMACNGKGITAPAFIEISRAGKNKHTARIRPAAVYWQNGHVLLLRNAPGLQKLMDQMSRLTPEMAHDDWADAAADVFHPMIYQTVRRPRKPGSPVDISNPTDAILKEKLQYYPDRESNYVPVGHDL